MHEIVDLVVLEKFGIIENLSTYFNLLINTWKINLRINKSKEITEFIAYIDNLISIANKTSSIKLEVQEVPSTARNENKVVIESFHNWSPS